MNNLYNICENNINNLQSINKNNIQSIQKETYNYEKNIKNIKIEKIENIALTNSIIHSIKFDSDIDKDEVLCHFPILPNDNSLPLNRINNMINLFNNNTKLPPIMVTKHKRGFYIINDGRHRFACSIMKGYKYIPIIIN